MTIHKSLNTTLVLSIILVGLLAYSFLKADWTPPPANPPANNVDAPINVGATYQAKTGDLGAVKMRAGAYCDASGENCLSNPSGGGGNQTELLSQPINMPTNIDQTPSQLGLPANVEKIWVMISGKAGSHRTSDGDLVIQPVTFRFYAEDGTPYSLFTAGDHVNTSYAFFWIPIRNDGKVNMYYASGPYPGDNYFSPGGSSGVTFPFKIYGYECLGSCTQLHSCDVKFNWVYSSGPNRTRTIKLYGETPLAIGQNMYNGRHSPTNVGFYTEQFPGYSWGGDFWHHDDHIEIGYFSPNQYISYPSQISTQGNLTVKSIAMVAGATGSISGTYGGVTAKITGTVLSCSN